MKRTAGMFLALLGVVGLVAAPSKPAQSRANTFDVINFKPAVDSTRFITLYDAENHQKGEWNVGAYLDYAHHPLEIAAGRGVRRAGVVDDTLVLNILGSYGITDWLEAGARVPIVPFNNYKGLPGTIAKPNSIRDFSMGDVEVDLKFRLLESKYVGIGVIPFITAPSGRPETFMGKGTVSGGGKLAVHFDPHERVRLGLNGGFVYNKTVNLFPGTANPDIASFVTLGAGVNIRPHNRFDIIAEGQVNSVAKNFFGDKIQSPAEVDGAVRFHATKNLDVTAGGGAGLTIGVGSPDFRAFLGLNYTRHKEEEKPKQTPPKSYPKKITIDQMIHFDFDKSNIRPDAARILDDVAAVLSANPGVKKIRIESHTDAVGTDAYNMKLSQRRANSTKEYLVRKGIDPSRLEAVGYGESRPVDTNSNAAGRAKNRRSEFNVIEQ